MVKALIYSVLLIFTSCTTNRVCRDPAGKEVDWYSIFLMPTSVSSDASINYGYFDSTLSDLEFYKYDENTFPPTHITKYITSGDSDFNYFLWNDDKTVKGGPFESASSSKAHAKGTLIYDANLGSFLLHSLPRFPTRTLDNQVLTELPSNAGPYGQNFLCITITKSTAESIVKMLDCININVNKAVDSDRVNSYSPNEWVINLINNKMDISCPLQHTKTITSKEGVEFTFYGKNYKNKIIPYDTTMRQAYNDDFFVRTWSRPFPAPAQYDMYNLVNVLEVKFDSYSYPINKEHSKWAITENKNIVCFGDLNHVESQKDRGGHIVCFENDKLHTIMKNAIVSTDSKVVLSHNKYYNLASNDNICSSKNIGCSFYVTNNYPISLKIPTYLPTKAILGDYKYIYLKFTIPEKQKQKSFYLEAYYISDEETIISDGDCYFVNTNENVDYELRIYKNLRKKDYIRFGFFGLSDDFIMEVKLHFNLNVTLYFNDIALSNTNSLKRNNISSLEKYLLEREKQLVTQKNREKIAKETCYEIMKNVFDTYLDVELFEGDTFLSSIINPISPFIITTVSYTVGLVMTIENFFHPESIILSETTIKNGKIVYHKDGLDYLDGNALINNDVLKMIELYNKRITDTALDFGMDRDFTLIISTNKDINYIIYTLKFYEEKNELIYYEIQYKIQLTNYKINELIVNIPTLPEIFNFLPNVEQCFSENAISLKQKIEYIMKGVNLINGISDLSKYNPILAHKKASLLIKETDWAEVGGTLLDMDADEEGIYHARFDCWQQCVGYTRFYDNVFDLFTDMRYNSEGMFKFNGQNYILWAWKGDYLNLGAGAELGFYYGGEDVNSIWQIDKSLAMPMTLTLIHKIYGTIVDNWKNTTWWITAFNPNYKDVFADDLKAYYTVEFINDDMFDEFAKIERKGWTYNKTSKIASLIL